MWRLAVLVTFAAAVAWADGEAPKRKAPSGETADRASGAGEAEKKAALERLKKRLELDDYLVRMATLNGLFERASAELLEPVRRVFESTDDTDCKFWCACIMLKLGDKKAYKFLLKAFLSESERERYHAAAAFGRARVADAEVKRRIEELWRNDVEQVRTVAAYALASVGDERGYAFLMEKVRDSKWPARDMAAVLLGWLGREQSKPILRKGFAAAKDASDKNLPICFAWALSHYGDADAQKYLLEAGHGNLYAQMGVCEVGRPMVPHLIKALKHQKPSVRRNAAMLLGLIGDAEAVAPLTKALSDGTYSVACAAAVALGYTMHPAAVAPLAALVADKKSNSTVKRRAMQALAVLKDDRGVPAIRSVLFGEAVRDKGAASRRLRENAAAALAEIGSSSAVAALLAFIGDAAQTERLRTAAVDYIRRASLKSAAPALVEIMDGAPRKLKAKIVQALRKLTGKDCGDDPAKWRKALKSSSGE